MYFFAFPLLFLVASTACASPVHIESRGNSQSRGNSHSPGNPQSPSNSQTRLGFSERELPTVEVLTKQVMKRKNKSVSKAFHSDTVKIDEWSKPDEVVALDNARYREELGDTMIKRVDLSTVKHEDGVTKKKQLFRELLMLKAAELLIGWDMQKESKDGKTTTYYYIGIRMIGVPVSQTSIMAGDRLDARRNGLQVYKGWYSIEVDAAHSLDNKDFFFQPDDPEVIFPPPDVPFLQGRPMAYPHSLRYAKIVDKNGIIHI